MSININCYFFHLFIIFQISYSYSTRNFKQLNNSFYKLQTLEYYDHPLEIDFTNLITATMKNVGLTVSAFQPSALIKLSSRVTVAETERLRRSATVYDQKMNIIQQITIGKDFIQNVGFSRECEVLILTLDGQLHIYNLWNKDQPINTINLVEGVFDTSVKCVDMSQITFLPGYRFNVTVYSAKRNMWYQLNCSMKQQITSEEWQILTFSSPIKQIPISFDIYRSQMPGTVIISQAYRPNKQIFNIEDGQVEIVVLMQSGNVYKLQQNRQDHQQSHTLLCQTNVIQGSNAQLQFDPSRQFFSIFTPVGQNYLSYNHVQLKSELLDKIIAYKAIPDDEKKEQEDDYVDAIKTIKALTTSGALELEPQIRYYQSNSQFVIKIYDFSAQRLLFDQTVQDLHCQDVCGQSIIMQSYWCSESIPMILYKSQNFWNLLAVGRQQFIYYQLCPSNQKPILSTECDGIQIISKYSLQKLQVIHPYTVQMWYQSFAFSEAAHLLEAYKTYDQISFQADDLARQLQQRSKDTSSLILGIAQAAIQENEYIGNTMLKAAQYLKVYDKDANTNTLQTFLPLFAPKKDISLKNANYVSQYYAPILQALFTGQPVQAIFDNQVYYFTPYLCYINSQSQQTNTLWTFDHKNWLSDQLIIAKMIHSTSCRLRQEKIHISGQQIISLSLNGLITFLSSTKNFGLAQEICEYWKMSQSILTINYINQLLYLHPRISDKALLKFLNQTRKMCFNISNSQLANVLIIFNRYNLANYLVLKQSIEDSVILNLKMMNFGRAVVASLKSGDKNLVLYSIQQAIRGSNGGAELVYMVCQEPELALLLNQLYRYEGQQNLQDIAEQTDPELYLFKLQFELGKLAKAQNPKEFLDQIGRVQDTQRMCKDLERQIDKAKVQLLVDQAKKLVQGKQNKTQSNFNLTIKTQSDLEKISNKAKKLLNKQKKINIKKYFQVDQALYKQSVMNFFDLIDVPQQMNQLIICQQEIQQQTNVNVIGLTVFDTLCFLYKGFFTELTESKYDQTQELIEKIQNKEAQPKNKVNWSKLIQSFIKQMQIGYQVQQAAYCQTVTVSCNYTPLLVQVLKEFKKNFNPYLGYKISYKIHALTVCDKFISMIEDERKQFVYYLTINMRDRCVMLFRRLGKQVLQEIYQEFYSNSLAQGTIKRFIYELDVE